MSSVRSPERNRPSMGSVHRSHQQSPTAMRQLHSPSRKSAPGSPVKKPNFLASLQVAGASSKMTSLGGSSIGGRSGVTGSSTTTTLATTMSSTATTNSASAASTQLSKEASRYSRQLEALRNGPALSARRGGGFSNSSSGGAGAGGSRFSASATAGLLGSGRSALLLGPSPSISRTLASSTGNSIKGTTGAAIGGNATFNMTSATSTSTTFSNDNFSIDPPRTPSNSNNRTSLSSTSVPSTPKSILGKRNSAGIGIFPSTPSQLNISPSPTPFSVSTVAGDPTALKTPVRKTFNPNMFNGNSTSSENGTRPATPKTPLTSPQRLRTPGGGLSRVTSSSSIVNTKSLAAQAASCLTRSVSSGSLTTTKKLEVVKNDWLGAPASPKKGKRTFNPGDRFIPRRIDMASAQVKIDMAKGSTLHRAPSFSGASSSTHHHIPIDSLDGSAYSQEVARACGLDLNSRILCFNAEAPSLDSRESSVVRQMYSRHPSFTRSNSNLLLRKRTILTSPEKILDAPGLVDDYYLNLLSWSCTNQLAIGLDKSAFVWNADSGQVESLVTVKGNMDSITSVSWANDGSTLAVGTFEGDVQVWDVETKTKIRTMSGHSARVGVLAWDKHVVSSGCRDGSIWNHDVRVHNHKVAELSSHTNEVCGLTWRGDGAQLASGANDNIVNIWDARSTVPKYTKTNHTAAVKALAWCPWQSNLLASGGGTYDKQIHFWNSTTGARVNTLNAGSQVTSIVWSKEYKEFMSSHGYPNNNLSVYSYPSMNKVVDIPAAHDSRVLHSAVSPDGQTVATVANDENLKFWKLFEKQPKDGKGGSGGGSKRAKSLSGSSGSGTGGGLLDDDGDCGGDGGSGGGFLNGKSISSMTRIR